MRLRLPPAARSGHLRIAAALGAFLAAAALGGCQSGAPAPEAQAQRPVLVTPSTFRLPEGSGCSGEIARFRAVQANDLETGHVNRSVYDRIAQELAEAERTCAAGNDAGARAALRATKVRYGYPA